jgi:demethylmenaquinone methyltransferase/2-methoxy-6-polyprenyl-1,4-benzoquinol methylase
VVHGVDLSPGMLDIAKQYVTDAGYTNIDLREADARSLPFGDDSFDLLYNGYMLDLISFADMPVVLREFRRVLKPGGRLVLLNMSKPDERRTLMERLYQWLPQTIVLYFMGGCRPVLMTDDVREVGFHDVRREHIGGAFSSEVVTAIK